MIIIGKGVKPAAGNKKRRNAARKKGTKFKGIF